MPSTDALPLSASNLLRITSLSLLIRTDYRSLPEIAIYPNEPTVSMSVVVGEGDMEGIPVKGAARSFTRLAPGRVASVHGAGGRMEGCLLYTSPSPRDGLLSRMPSSA